MYPGINPRQMAQAMKKLGISQEEIDAQEVIIRCADKDIIVKDPQVTKVNMQGTETLQITGELIERKREVELSEEDIETVMGQTGVSREAATEAIKKADFDLAKAILDLQK